MNNRSRVAIGVALGLVLALTVTGCSASQYPEKPAQVVTETGVTSVETEEASTGYASRSVTETVQIISDGRSVTCLLYASGYGGGISCDWENAK